MRRIYTLFVITLIGVLLAACATRDADGPPRRAPDLSRVTDPVPRVEPLSRWGNPSTYQVFGRTYRVMDSVHSGFTERGIASWYGTKFHGRRTSSGEEYDMYAMTAAHKSLPLPSYVRVRHLETGRQIVVRVNDRGPFADGRIIDLSYAAAYRLGMLDAGTAPVEIEVLAAPRMATAEPSITRPVQGGSASYIIQAAAFSERGNAERLRDRLRRANLGAHVEIQTAELPRGPVYRVRLGPLNAADQVERISARLADFDIIAPQVIVR